MEEGSTAIRESIPVLSTELDAPAQPFDR
jgi:hypothetical protein